MASPDAPQLQGSKDGVWDVGEYINTLSEAQKWGNEIPSMEGHMPGIGAQERWEVFKALYVKDHNYTAYVAIIEAWAGLEDFNVKCIL